MITPAKKPFHVLTKPIGPLCNLRCEYCFYLEKDQLFDVDSKRAYRMSDEVLEEYTRQYIASQHPDAKEVNFAWQGGEPTLLGIEFFRRAVAYQKKYSRSGMKISNALQTNATLLNDEWGKFLHDNDFLVGISIDGPEELHNRFRRDRHGRGSFARVMAGLDAMKRNQVEYNTLTVVQRDNANHPERVYQFLKSIGSDFMQFIPIVEPVGGGNVSDRTVLPEQWGRFLSRILDVWRQGDIGTIYVQHFELMIGLILGLPASLCVHGRTCGRSVAIEHNGNLYSCDHFVFPQNFIGNLMETPLPEMLDGRQQTDFGKNKYDSLPKYCLDCDFLRFCYGGCPSNRVGKAPGGETGLNWLCKGYKQFYRYSARYFRAIGECLRRQLPPQAYGQFLSVPAARGQVGRNDPCPCGSGKKYKRCCGR